MSQTSNGAINAGGGAGTGRLSFRRYLATSDRAFPTLIRTVYKRCTRFSLPAPRALVKPMLWAYLAFQTCWLFFLRVFVCEPLFKAYFTKYGRDFTGGCYIPWIIGKGDILVGDDVIIGGKFVVGFGTRFTDHPTLKIGNNVVIGHDTQLTIGRQVTIGDNCRISGSCWIADSNGHTTEFDASTGKHKPPSNDDVRPVVIGNDVWIGRQCLIFPGVKIGDGTVVAAGSVVRGHLPPYCVAAGNPAKVLFRLKRPAVPEKTSPAESTRFASPEQFSARACESQPALNGSLP